MKRMLFVAAALAGGLLSLPAAAAGRLATVEIYDRAQNRTLPVYLHQGRHYVAGNPGNEYEIRLRNRQPGDLLAVVSVDGVDVITGETADWQQSGYVLGSRQSFGIRGWRKSLDRVAAFYFTALPDSYAARTGRPDNVGVIGVALFRRKPEPAVLQAPPRLSRDAESAAAPAAAERSAAGPAAEDSGSAAGMGAGAAQKPARLGTGHGRNETSVVTYTEFERASTAPAELITIYYDSHRNLAAQGVIRTPVATRPDPWPVPFPGRFAPDPR
ncbi:MAG: hypothetical protein KF771_12565 [Burkholderiales bacterium]|nr:hypothetical protein [Burkholderiales bacterium]